LAQQQLRLRAGKQDTTDRTWWRKKYFHNFMTKRHRCNHETWCVHRWYSFL